MTLLQRAGVIDRELYLRNPLTDKLFGNYFPERRFGVSLNPPETQLMQIKCTHLERMYNRSGLTPAMRFYGKPKDALYKWLNDNGRMSVYLRMGKYGNNFEI